MSGHAHVVIEVPDPTPVADLSRTELALLHARDCGINLKRIAKERGVSIRTVTNKLRLLENKLAASRSNTGEQLNLRKRALSALAHAHERSDASCDWWSALLDGKHVYADLFSLQHRQMLILRERRKLVPLSIGEIQTLALYIAGLTFKEIAADHSGSPSSANTHLRRALKKLGFASRAQLRSAQHLLSTSDIRSV